MWQKNKILVIAVLINIHIFCSQRGYGSLREIPLGKEQAAQQIAQQFKEKYQTEFMLIWKERDAKYKKEYETKKVRLSSNNPNNPMSQKQFIFNIMKEAYKQKHTEHYQLRAEGEQSKNLDEQAHRAVESFIEENTTCGSCWLCCANITQETNIEDVR